MTESGRISTDVVHHASADDLADVAERLLVQLQQLGVTPNPSCELMRARKVVLELFDELKATGMTVGGNFGQRVDCILLVRQWARMLSWGIGSPLEDDLRALATTITSGDPSMHGDGPQSMARDQAFEVYVGCLATRFADDVRFKEPDVVLRLEGKSVGIACKALYGTDGSRPLRKGREQIEQADCNAGIVLAQVTNRIDRDELFRCTDAGTQEYPVWELEVARERFDRLAVAAASPLERAAKGALASNPKILGILAIGEGVCLTTKVGITLLHLPYAIPTGDPSLQSAWPGETRRQAFLKVTKGFEDAFNRPRM